MSAAPTVKGSDASNVKPFKADAPLKITQQPQNLLAFTNHVFAHPDTAQAYLDGAPDANRYVSIAGLVFILRSNAAVAPGSIGLNKLQRDSCQLGENDSVIATIFAPPSNDPTFGLASLRIEFETYATGNRKIIFKEEEMVRIVKETFAGHVFGKSQQFWGRFGDLTLVYRIKSLEAPIKDEKEQAGRGQVTRPVESGMLMAHTKVKMLVKAERAAFLSLEESDERPPIFDPDWSFTDMGIGGLDLEFNHIFRRAFASRMFPPSVIDQLGIKHVKGMLLYGPPGTGKTLIARQIGKLLKGKEPKVVNGPEVLNKFVGQSEENIRNLFKEAEKDQEEKKDKSPLHVIIFDEIDAICKSRGSVAGSAGVHDTVVNQLLAKIDGVNQLNNILLVGMTNRKDMIDPALLRPGRLEVHIEIGLPDVKGRHQILLIHTRRQRENGKLASDVNLAELAELTKNFSGAEIEGLVRSATSFAMYANVDATSKVDVKIDAEHITVTMEHFRKALAEVIPAFGVADEELKNMMRGKMVNYSDEFQRLEGLGKTWLAQVQNSEKTPLLSVLLEGDPGSGKSALAAHLAADSRYPFTKVVSPEMYLGFSDAAKSLAIAKVFEDAYKSRLSCVILDDIERLLEYAPVGPRFSNAVLQTVLVLLKRAPPNGKSKLMVIATTSSLSVLKDLDLGQAFNVAAHVPRLSEPQHLKRVFQGLSVPIEEKEMEAIAQKCALPLGIKQLLMLIEMAAVQGRKMSSDRFLECVRDCGLQRAPK